MTVIGGFPKVKQFKETEPEKLEEEMRKYFMTNPRDLIASDYIGNNTFVFFFRGEI